MLDMSKYTATTEVRDNVLTLNNVTFKLTDTEAAKILEVLKSFSEPNSPVSRDSSEKKATPSNKGLSGIQYHIKKHDKLFCISRGVPYTTKNGREGLKNGGWSYAEKRCINEAIKALPNIKTIAVAMDNGRTYSAWGFPTKKAAEAAMATLPTSFTAEEVAKFERTR